MKNVTVTLPEDLAVRARVAAARENKSLSRYIADLLARSCPQADTGGSRADAVRALESFLQGPGFPGISKAWKGRDALYAEREDELLRRYDASRLRGRSGRSGQAADRGGFAEGDRPRRNPRAQRPKPK
jgi:hypothetical protein